MEHKNLLKKISGFVPAEIKEDHWQLGGNSEITAPVLTDGHWLTGMFVPKGERQVKNFDSFGCTIFQYLNCIEILWSRVRKEIRNFSDRWLYIVSGTKPPGNDQHSVAEWARKNGLVDESSLPWDDSIATLDEFKNPDVITPKLREEANQFLIDCEPQHDWTPSNKDALKNALQWSPLGVAVEAWFQNENGLYYSPQLALPNHATTLIDFRENDYFLVLDSYPETNEGIILNHMAEFEVGREIAAYLKKLVWDFNFPYKSKRYWLGPGLKEQISILQKIVNLLAKIVTLLGLNQKVVSKPVPASTPKTSRIIDWANAITQFENTSKTLKNNPGALKNINGKFMEFKTYDEGFSALTDYLLRVATNKHKADPKGGETSLQQFFDIYAPSSDKNDPIAYCKFIAKQLDVSIDVRIKELI